MQIRSPYLLCFNVPFYCSAVPVLKLSSAMSLKLIPAGRQKYIVDIIMMIISHCFVSFQLCSHIKDYKLLELFWKLCLKFCIPCISDDFLRQLIYLCIMKFLAFLLILIIQFAFLYKWPKQRREWTVRCAIKANPNSGATLPIAASCKLTPRNERKNY